MSEIQSEYVASLYASVVDLGEAAEKLTGRVKTAQNRGWVDDSIASAIRRIESSAKDAATLLFPFIPRPKGPEGLHHKRRSKADDHVMIVLRKSKQAMTIREISLKTKFTEYKVGLALRDLRLAGHPIVRTGNAGERRRYTLGSEAQHDDG